ncbi:MAG TPA: hypothetical protein PLL07_09925 [Nitrosomonas sp.]|nr:hypothetical protein [Nitrosomonas sp.]
MGRCIYCQKTFDFNTNGLTHIGIVPDMLDDFQSMDMTPSDFDPILDSATAYVRLWKYAKKTSNNQINRDSMAVTDGRLDVVSGCNQLLMGTGSQLRAQDDITAGRQIRLSPRFKHLSLLAYLLWYRAEW